jgi:hypothetical protein
MSSNIRKGKEGKATEHIFIESHQASITTDIYWGTLACLPIYRKDILANVLSIFTVFQAVEFLSTLIGSQNPQHFCEVENHNFFALLMYVDICRTLNTENTQNKGPRMAPKKKIKRYSTGAFGGFFCLWWSLLLILRA